MSEQLLTFEEVLQSTSSKMGKTHLLLGNGFSIAYSPTIFSYQTLIEAALERNVLTKDDHLYKVFKTLNTADFESVMRALDSSVAINRIYECDSTMIDKISADSALLKQHLARIITVSHPEKSTSVDEQHKAECLKFLANFDDIYTLNYDLLLYWATISDQDSYKDGFGESQENMDSDYVVYKHNNSRNVFYVHGALHLFDAGSEMRKATWSKTDIPLIEQIQASLDANYYPVFISEGDSTQKLTKIRHNSYLSSTFNSLCNIGGKLVVFGSPLKENDEHIVNAILKNKAKDIYVGTSTLQAAQHIVDIFSDYNSSDPNRQKNLQLFDYKTVNPWGKQNA